MAEDMKLLTAEDVAAMRETCSNRNTATSELTLEMIEESLSRFSQQIAFKRFRRMQREFQHGTCTMARLKAAEWGFLGNGIYGTCVTAAPDVVERLHWLPQAQPGTIAPLYLSGLPVYVDDRIPAGHWLLWENRSPVEVGRIVDGEAGGRGEEVG